MLFYLSIYLISCLLVCSNLILLNIGAKLITFRGDLPHSSQEIIQKLELLDEEDVIGSGGFGTVYKMVMDDCSAFAVKKIERNHESCDKDFDRELEILGSIKHINLVHLRGYCRLPTAKLLIYDYLALGSLDHYLHGKFLSLTCGFFVEKKHLFLQKKSKIFQHLTGLQNWFCGHKL